MLSTSIIRLSTNIMNKMGIFDRLKDKLKESGEDCDLDV